MIEMIVNANSKNFVRIFLDNFVCPLNYDFQMTFVKKFVLSLFCEIAADI